jgi:hypothetical protein
MTAFGEFLCVEFCDTCRGVFCAEVLVVPLVSVSLGKLESSVKTVTISSCFSMMTLLLLAIFVCTPLALSFRLGEIGGDCPPVFGGDLGSAPLLLLFRELFSSFLRGATGGEFPPFGDTLAIKFSLLLLRELESSFLLGVTGDD